MTDDSYIHVGRYYVGVTVYEIVDWYRGEDSGARYPEFGNYQIAEHCDFSPVLNTVMSHGKTIQTYLDDIVKHWPPYAGKHYSPVGYSFVEYAKSIPGVIISKYGKNYGIISYLPEKYDNIFFLYNSFYAVKQGDLYSLYRAGDIIKDEDFKYQNIRDLGDFQIETTFEGRKTILSLEHNEAEILCNYNFESIDSLKVDDDTFSLLWPELKSYETFMVCLDGKYGVINTRTGWIISNKYDSIKFLKNSIYIASCISSKFGLIDVKENIIYPSQFDHIGSLDFEIQGLWDSCTNDDTFYYTENGLKGLFNLNKDVIFSASYNSIIRSAYNRLEVKINNKCGIVEPSGKIIIPCNYDEIVAKDKLYSVINHTNHPQYSWQKQNIYGLISYNGALLIPCEYNDIIKSKDYFVVVKNGLYGCLNIEGNVIIDIKYQYLKVADNLFIASIYSDIYKKNVYGVIDDTENVIIPFFYTNIEYIGSGNFNLSVQSKSVRIRVGVEATYSDIKPLCKNLLKRKLIAWGIVDERGNEITPCIYSDIKYDEDLDIFRVSTSTEKEADYKKWGLLDGKGKVLCSPKFNKISIFKDGLATVSADYGRGIISKEGRLIPSKVVKLDSTYSAVYSIGRWAFLKNGDGALVTDYKYKSIYCMSEGYYIVEFDDFEHYSWDNKTHSGLLDKDLNTIIPIEYNSISKLTDDLILVGKKTTAYNSGQWQYYYGCLNFEGKVIFTTDYDEISVLENGYIKLKKFRNCSIYNQDGACLIDKGFIDITWEQTPNLYRVFKPADNWNNKVGLFNQNGQELIEPKYDELSFLHDDRFILKLGASRGVCDINDRIIVPCEYHSIEYCGDGYLVKKSYRSNAPIAKLDLDGKVIPNNISNLSCDYKKGEIFGKWAVLDKHHEAITEFEYNSLEGLENFILYKKNGKPGLLDENLECVINHEENYSDINYDNGIIHVCVNNGRYLLDENYRAIPIYTKTPIGNYVKKTPGGFYFCDDSKKELDNKCYEDITIISEFVCIVKACQNRSKLYGLTNCFGNPITDKKFINIEPIGNNRFIVNESNKFGIIDRCGKELLPFVFYSCEKSMRNIFLFRLSIVDAKKLTNKLLSYCKKTSLTEYQLSLDVTNNLPDFNIENPNQLELNGVNVLGVVELPTKETGSTPKTFTELKKGIGYVGVVKNKTAWGVFIELECGTGLLHISEIKGKGLELTDFTIGATVTVQLLTYDRFKNRVTFTI